MATYQFHVALPSPAMAPFIQVIWGVRGRASFDREGILPNGVIELMVNLGPTQKVWAYGERHVDEDFHRYWLAGIQDQPLVIGSPDGCDHLGVRFRPGGAHAFFGVPMDALTDRVVDLDLLVGREASEALRDRLALRADHQGRAREVEAWLLERCHRVHPWFATVREAVDLLQASRFRTSVTELCESLGLSNRHLIEQFRAVVGLTPKTFSRVARFHAVIGALRDGGDADWAALAYRFNFSDQPHLVREFRRFAGVTPTGFLARRTPEDDHLVVD